MNLGKTVRAIAKEGASPSPLTRPGGRLVPVSAGVPVKLYTATLQR